MKLFYDKLGKNIVRLVSRVPETDKVKVKYFSQFRDNIRYVDVEADKIKEISTHRYFAENIINNPILHKLYTPLEIIKIRNYYNLTA